MAHICVNKCEKNGKIGVIDIEKSGKTDVRGAVSPIFFIGADGIGADGFGSGGIGADGIGSGGIGADGIGSGGIGADGSFSDGVGADCIGSDGVGADGIDALERDDLAADGAVDLTSADLLLDWDGVLSGGALSSDAPVPVPSDALILSLSNLGRVDMPYIMKITGQDLDAVIKALRGSIYQNPEKWEGDPLLGWETAEEYLSGNLRTKLRAARRAAKEHPRRFNGNVTAIKKLLPEAVTAKDIYVTLGSPWVPVDVVEDFVMYLFRFRNRDYFEIKHDEYTSTWEIPRKSHYASRFYVAACSTWGTMRMDAFTIIERTLNMKGVAVYDEKQWLTSQKRVLNHSETVSALDKQAKIIEAFQGWVWKDEKRKERLERIFESRYSCVRRRIFDGSFLRFPGLAPHISLYPYQKNAVARILFSPNTLLAHEVGSGKTYVMIAAGMELKRMGLSRKNLYVVPNNLVSQWKGFFEEMYPTAKVFCVETKNFTPSKREGTLIRVRDGDWDAVIMAYSCFERIPLSLDFLFEELQEVKKKIQESEAREGSNTSNLRRKREQLAKQMAKMAVELDKEVKTVCFDNLGITRMFVDEAHNYKNVPIETKTDRVLGINAGGSKKCKDMLAKVHFVQKQNEGGGVVMATGTPITNSLTEAFVMQQYLQSGELAMLDLQSFDSWVGMFAERTTDFEIDVDTNSYRLATRFAKFHNLPELTALFSSIADFHQVDESIYLPDFDGYTDTVVKRMPPFEKYLRTISERAELVRGGVVDRKEDNMLKITTDGRKAALDLRLACPKEHFSYESKVVKCADNVAHVYRMTAHTRGTQLIFCDSSTPKEGFNIYDEMKRLLLLRGISASEIAYVHDADTEAQRAKLFARVREGEIRVLIGSTFKLGMGVNVQNKLIAIHHLDVPWRPADMTQREGRILRQGNQNDKVYIYRYITEGSFDAYSWQLLETKQRFISELLAGSLTERSGTDVDSTVLNYAEIKAVAVGNPLVKKRVETANELTRVSSLRAKAIETKLRIEQELREMPAKIAHQKEVLTRCRSDIKWYRANRTEPDKDERRALRENLASAIAAHLSNPSEARVLMTYQGFHVVMSADISREKPYLTLERNGKYVIELGESEMGAFARIENFLDKIGEHAHKLNAALTALQQRERSLAEEAARSEDYTDKIEELREKLAKIDKKLGVSA